jgi:hypothetical protein
VEKDNRGEVVHIDDNLPKRKAEKLFGKYIRDRHYEIWANYRRKSLLTNVYASSVARELFKYGIARGVIFTGYSDFQADKYFEDPKNSEKIETEIMNRLDKKGITEDDADFNKAYKAEKAIFKEEYKKKNNKANNTDIEKELEFFSKKHHYGYLKRDGGWTAENPNAPSEPSFVVYYPGKDEKGWKEFLETMKIFGNVYGQKEITVFKDGEAVGHTTTEHVNDDGELQEIGHETWYGDYPRWLKETDKNTPFTNLGSPKKDKFSRFTYTDRELSREKNYFESEKDREYAINQRKKYDKWIGRPEKGQETENYSI